MDMPDKPMTPAAAKLFRLTRSLGMSDANLARLCRVDAGTISRLRNEGAGITTYLAQKFRAGLGVDLNWLLDDQEEGPPPEPAAEASRAVVLTDAERAILEIVRRLGRDDPDLIDAEARLLLRGYMRSLPSGAVPPPPGASAGRPGEEGEGGAGDVPPSLRRSPA